MRRLVAALALLTVAGLLVAAPAPAGGPPSNFVRHEGQHWTWYAPGGWIASEGANDIYIGSPTGSKFLHYGASAAPCSYPPYYTNVAEFFRYLRNSYLQLKGQAYDFYSFPLASARYTNIRPIRALNQTYYRQTSTFQGKTRNGTVIQGEMVLDFFAVDSFGNCGERQQIRSAPRRGIADSIRQLRTVQKFIFGPR